ncbi:MAG: PhnD/SsuA/transferrin family substrate-binding protein [Gallionella sp.]
MQSLFSLRNLAISLAVFVGLLVIVAIYAEPVLRISTIIDGPPAAIKRNMHLLAGYLERKIGMRVEYRPKRDDDAMVVSLLYKELDLVWIDGARLALARSQGHDGVLSIVQRGGSGFVRSASVGDSSDPTYSWAIREGLDAELRQKLTDAFLAIGTDSGK